MAFLDWLRRREPTPHSPPPVVDSWHVSPEEGWVVVSRDDGGDFARVPLGSARSVRVVPLTHGDHHSGPSGWQVCLAHADGDVLVGPTLRDWQNARGLAECICKATQLPMDELTEKLFSQVGRLKL